jgi:hypothetical protein
MPAPYSSNLKLEGVIDMMNDDLSDQHRSPPLPRHVPCPAVGIRLACCLGNMSGALCSVISVV